MKTWTFLTVVVAIGIFFFMRGESHFVKAEKPSEVLALLLLTSPVFRNGESIPSKYTCDGKNVNPSFHIENVPVGAKTLALVFDDPDLRPNPWVHWVLWNIPATTTEIAENSVPPGAVEGKTSFKDPGYGGPCPPTGAHEYSFRLYALDTMLELPKESRKADLEKAMEGHVLEEAELLGTYLRK